MQITKSKLRQIIKEELKLLSEQSIPQDMIERLDSAMQSIAEFVMDKYDENPAAGADLTKTILQDSLNGVMESIEEMAVSPGNDPVTDNDLSDELAATFSAPKDDGSDYADSGEKLRMVAEMLGVDAPEGLLFSEDFDAIDAFEATSAPTSFSSPMESGTSTRGTFKGQPAVLVYVMGNTTLFVEGA